MQGLLIGAEVAGLLLALAILVYVLRRLVWLYEWIDRHSTAAPALLGGGVFLLVSSWGSHSGGASTEGIIGLLVCWLAAMVDVIWHLHNELEREREWRDQRTLAADDGEDR